MKPSPSVKGSDTLLLTACSTAMITLVPVALYQAGAIRHLADPPSPIFNSERITRSKAAHPLGIPDAFLGLASFATTLTLILFARRHRVAKELLGAKLTLDASAAAFNAGRQVVGFKQLCSWCTGTAIAAGVMAYAGRDTVRHTWADARAILKDPKV